MPRGDKSSYTDKQKRQAEHIEEGYENRGVPEKEAERRAWATVNKETGGGKKSGSGRGQPENHAPSRKGGRLGGKARRRGRKPTAQPPPRRRQRPASGTLRTDKKDYRSVSRSSIRRFFEYASGVSAGSSGWLSANPAAPT